MPKKTSLIDRIKNSIRAFRCKPIRSIHYGVNITRCDECEHWKYVGVLERVYKDLVDFHHNGADTDFDEIIGYLGQALDD